MIGMLSVPMSRNDGKHRRSKCHDPTPRHGKVAHTQPTTSPRPLRPAFHAPGPATLALVACRIVDSVKHVHSLWISRAGSGCSTLGFVSTLAVVDGSRGKHRP